MADPFSLGALGMLAAAEGIKFLYGQAAEVLGRWRERKAGKAGADGAVEGQGADVLEGRLEAPTIDFDVVERLHEDMTELAGVLSSYANGIKEPTASDSDMVDAADALRRALEAVYGQRITFKGEAREASGPIVVGRIDVDTIAGDVAGVRARLIRSGRVEGHVTAKEITGGEVRGVDVDTVG